MNFKKGHGYSWTAILVVLIAGLYVNMDLELWKQRDRVIEWDVHSYYAYLPAVFIYDDIHLSANGYRFDGDYFLFWPTITDDGAKVIKTTMGLSMLYAPFFFMGHGYAHLFGYPIDGWSAPYKVFLLFGGLCYLVIGLVLVKKILERSGFGDKPIAATLLLLGLGTNLFCYGTQSGTMSHVYSFTLIAAFMYLTLIWHDRPGLRTAILLGLVLGLISLVRPVNALVVLFFAFVGVAKLKDLQDKTRLLLSNISSIAVIAVTAILVWVPQFVYWETVTGSFLFDPYVGEGFFWGRPHILEGLFGFRKGWFIYTPAMFFAVLGIFFMHDRAKRYRTAISVFLIVNIYVTFSWWCWWYGGSYGQRSLVDSYALMAIPLCALVDRWRTWRKPVILAGAVLGAFFIWLNVLQTYQFELRSLHYDAMTRELYFKQFGRTECIPGFDELLDHPDYDKARTSGQ